MLRKAPTVTFILRTRILTLEASSAGKVTFLRSLTLCWFAHLQLLPTTGTEGPELKFPRRHRPLLTVFFITKSNL